MDFGGALGSAWWQHRGWLGDLTDVRWSVVEQESFVVAGKREFAGGALRFYESVDACFMEQRPNVILLSSVLPYLENPHALLKDLARRSCGRIIIDRTGFVSRGRDRLTVQHVPKSIYRASYPCWFFDRVRMLAPFAAEWRVTAEWTKPDVASDGFGYRGLALKRVSAPHQDFTAP